MTLTEYRGRVAGFQRAILAAGVTEAGEEVDLYVKAVLRDDDLSPLRLFAEWCGYELLDGLHLRIPRHFSTQVTRELIDSSGGGLRDVLPGPAFACEAIPFAMLAEFASDLSKIINREHMSGAVVADVVMGNRDRNGANVLLADESSGRRTLWLVDNGWTVLGTDAPSLEVEVSPDCIPISDELLAIVPDEASFGPYLLDVESLSQPDLESQFRTAPADTWEDGADLPTRAARAFTRRGQEARKLVMAEMLRFPNVRSGR